MATTKKQNKTSDTEEGTGKIKRLKLNKQTVRDLSAEELSKVKGGSIIPSKNAAMQCTTTTYAK